MAARDRKGKLMLAKYMLVTENHLLREIFRSEIENEQPRRWILVLREYMRELGINFHMLGEMSRMELKERVNRWDEGVWREEMERRTTLELYRHKREFGDEGIYENGWGSVLLFRCRTNTLMLGWRARFQNGDVSCVLCGADEETIEHFVLQCESLAEVRVRNGVTAGDTLQKVLLFEGAWGRRH